MTRQNHHDDGRIDVLQQAGQAVDVSTMVQRRIVRGAQTRRRASRRSWIGWSIPVAALAAAILCAVLWLPADPEPSDAATRTAVRSTTAAPAVAAKPSAIKPTVWQSAAAPLKVAFGSHHMIVAPKSSLRRLSNDPHQAKLRVDDGKVSFSVEPLQPGESFKVATPHLGVEVVGTRFTIDVEGACSRVDVTEGVVVVTRTGVAPVKVRAGSGRTHCATPDRPEQLSASEALVRQALRLESTEPARALAVLLRHVEQHPRSALAEEALFHAVVLSQRLGQEDRARVLARQFQQGFGHTDRARRLARLLKEHSVKKREKDAAQ